MRKARRLCSEWYTCVSFLSKTWRKSERVACEGCKHAHMLLFMNVTKALFLFILSLKVCLALEMTIQLLCWSPCQVDGS